MSKKLLSLALALVMSLSLCIPAWAMDTNDSTEASVPNTVTVVDCRNMSEAQREQAFQAFKRKIAGTTDVPMLRGNLGYSKTEYSDPVDRDVVGYPGKQPTRGYSAGPAGGSVYFTESGGPQVTISLNVGLPKINFMSVGISLGNMTDTTTGHGCNIPGSPFSNPVYYRVREIKSVHIRPYATYWRQTNLDPWELASSGQYVELVGIRSDPIRS